VHEAEDEVECHVIGIVESRENAEVSYVSDVRDETGSGPQFEGSMRGKGGLG
jgi:hypothetical protein